MKNRVIKVDTLSRVEGEGGIFIRIADGRITETKLRIYEPPRFFEAFLRGRGFAEAPDITARICGICPVAYQMSAVHAMEDAFGITVDGQLRELRRLLYCGEWIESHVLHVYMLHAPDFLGYDDALQLAKDKPDLVRDALRMKKIGNEIVSVVGGREIHPINVRVGGFYRVPGRPELSGLVEDLKWGRDRAVETVKLVAGLEFPQFEVDYAYVSLEHPTEYPMLGDRIATNRGLNMAVREYEFHFEERHLAHSNALHSVLKGYGNYHVGPLARFNLNYERLSPLARQAAQSVGLAPPVMNPFKSIIVRAIETVHAYDLALQIIADYDPPPEPCVPVTPVPGIGFGASEAPRGMLYHRYRLDDEGAIMDAKIVPPTAQNLGTIEGDLKKFVTANIDMEREQLTLKAEQTVRNYDPCISCATHAVTIQWD
jgi:coenzyme F420-reducing hydrogenase alpha subunit